MNPYERITMTENNTTAETIDEIEEAVESRFARIKSSLKNINPVYVAAAVSTAVAVGGMVFLSRQEKKATTIEVDTLIIEDSPETIPDTI